MEVVIAVSSFTLGKNVLSLKAQNRLAEANSSLTKAYERLSTGQRINRASDDAAGLAVASKLSAHTRVYTQALRNANDGISLIAVTGGSLEGLSSILFRLQELANQSANGSYSSAQRTALNNEAQSLRDEYNRMIGATKFNKQALIDGTLTNLAVQLGFSSQSFAVGQKLGRDIGNGTYTQSSTSTSGLGSSMQSADFNGDGLADLIGVTGGGDFILSLNNGNGGFTTTTFGGGAAGLSAVRVGDFNGDGIPDIATEGTYDSGTGFGALAISVNTWTNNGSGVFTAYQTTQLNYLGDSINDDSFNDMTVGDVNGDGRDDVAISHSGLDGITNSNIAIVSGNGGVLQALNTGSGSSGIKANLTLSDLNGDGYADLLYTRSTSLGVRLNTGGVIGGETSYTANPYYTVGDIDGDGDKDLIYYNSGSLFRMLWNGSGFGSATNIGSASVGQVRLYDYNGDGRQDLFTASSTMKGNGDGTFAAAQTHAATTNFQLGQMNSDGAIDIFSVGSYVYLSNTDKNTYMESFSLSSAANARSALTLFDGYQSRLISEKGAIGAVESRLRSSLRTVLALRDNYAEAKSRITDADVAAESAKAVKTRILQDTAAAVLAQADRIPSIALKLLIPD